VGTLATGTTSPLAPGQPATGWTTGNLALLIASTRAGAVTVDSIAGWQELVADGGRIKVFGRILQPGDTAPSVTYTGAGSQRRAQLCVFSGDVYSDITTIVHAATATTTIPATFPYEALTITDPNCLVLIVGFKYKTATSDGATVNNEAGFTRIDSAGAAGGQMHHVWDYVQQTSAVNVTAGEWDFTGTTETLETRRATLALKSLAAGGVRSRLTMLGVG
jgi:hypothetical protein